MVKRPKAKVLVVLFSAVLAAVGAVRAANNALSNQPLILVEEPKSAQVDNANLNTLSGEEKKAGWHLLFDGKTSNGWHNFKSPDIRPGWQVQDGALTCVDPRNAGDIVTAGKYDWFELSLEYKVSKGGNSGIIFHATDEGSTVWQTGPEIQLLDNKEGRDPNKAGWLYQLYTTETDATKPAGEWNHLRILISPEKCEHVMNGVKYFEYVLGSEDFNTRVAKSKFGRMPLFAKSDIGYIAFQGDHGQVAFRNIKIRPVSYEKKSQ